MCSEYSEALVGYADADAAERLRSRGFWMDAQDNTAQILR